MRPYIAFHKDKKVEVTAASSYAAQQQAAALFKVKPQKAYEVSVYLADVEHTPTF